MEEKVGAKDFALPHHERVSIELKSFLNGLSYFCENPVSRDISTVSINGS
jgi:hypothetical protein